MLRRVASLHLLHAGTAAGGLLGGCVGDAAAARWPHHGRIAVTQFSVAVGIPFACLVFKVQRGWAGTQAGPLDPAAAHVLAWAAVAHPSAIPLLPFVSSRFCASSLTCSPPHPIRACPATAPWAPWLPTPWCCWCLHSSRPGPRPPATTRCLQARRVWGGGGGGVTGDVQQRVVWRLQR